MTRYPTARMRKYLLPNEFRDPENVRETISRVVYRGKKSVECMNEGCECFIQTDDDVFKVTKYDPEARGRTQKLFCSLICTTDHLERMEEDDYSDE